MENALLADKKSLHFYVTLIYKVAQSSSGEMNKFKQEISIKYELSIRRFNAE